MQKPLKVGFDLDGVILYNPARFIRPVMNFLKRKKFVKRQKLEFYYPKNVFQKYVWILFHRSSLFLAPGFSDLKNLSQEGKIKAYLITGRFDFLKGDLNKRLKAMKADTIFEKIYWNKDDQPPHLFKEKMINQLKLDAFIEDNYDIVDYLSQVFKNTKLKVYWVYNFFDRKIDYQHKVPVLKKALDKIKAQLKIS